MLPSRESFDIIVMVMPIIGICINVTAALLFLWGAVGYKDREYARWCVYFFAAAILTTSIICKPSKGAP